MCTTGKDDFQIEAGLCFVNRLACVNLTCVWERQRKEKGSVEEGEGDSVTEIEVGMGGGVVLARCFDSRSRVCRGP